MSPTSAIVVFAVLWFLVMFITLQITTRTQGEDGEIVPGTHAGAPANFNIKRTMLVVTLITTVLWAIACGIILSGVITIETIDWTNRMDAT